MSSDDNRPSTGPHELGLIGTVSRWHLLVMGGSSRPWLIRTTSSRSLSVTSFLSIPLRR